MVLPRPRVWCWAVTSPFRCLNLNFMPFSLPIPLLSEARAALSHWQIYQQHLTHLQLFVNPISTQSPRRIWCVTLQSVKLKIQPHFDALALWAAELMRLSILMREGFYCSGPGWWCWASPLENSWENGLPLGMGLVESLANNWHGSGRGKIPTFKEIAPELLYYYNIIY